MSPYCRSLTRQRFARFDQIHFSWGLSATLQDQKTSGSHTKKTDETHQNPHLTHFIEKAIKKAI
jgi:hypothetical protein